MMPHPERPAPGTVLLLAMVACAVTAGLALQIPNPPVEPVGDTYQVGTGRHRGVVKVDPKLRADDGFELWFPRDQLKKAELVTR